MSIKEVQPGTTEHKFPGLMVWVVLITMALLSAGLTFSTFWSFMEIKEPALKYVFTGIQALGVVLIVWYLLHFYKISADVVTVALNGISRRDKDGKNSYISWQETGVLQERWFMQQMVVHDKLSQKKVVIDYQFEGFEDISRRIIQEKEKRVQYSYPAVFGKKVPHADPIAVVFTLCIMAMFLIPGLTSKKQDNIWLFVIMALIPLAVVLIYWLQKELTSIKETEVNMHDITLRWYFAEKKVGFGDILQIDYKYNTNIQAQAAGPLMSKMGGTYMHPALEIVTRQGKLYEIKKGTIPLIEAYLCMKKTSGIGRMK